MFDAIDPDVKLDHERLDAYAVAVELDGAVVALARKAGRGHAWLGDQVMRASASVVLNLAGGSGSKSEAIGRRLQWSLRYPEALGREGADRARALRIARGSALGGSMPKSRRRLGATHCVAIQGVDAALTLMLHRGACREAERKAAKEFTVRVVAMLTALRNRAAP